VRRFICAPHSSASVDPDQQNDEGGRGAIGRFDALLADVKTDEQLAISNRAAVTAAPSLFLNGSVKFDSRSANS